MASGLRLTDEKEPALSRHGAELSSRGDNGGGNSLVTVLDSVKAHKAYGAGPSMSTLHPASPVLGLPI